MDWQQFGWTSAITILGSGAGTTIVGFLFKRSLDRDLEKQKALLGRASRVHERQVNTLTKLYEQFSKMQAFLQLMAATARFEGEKPEEYPGLFLKAFESARDELLAGRLLISPELGRQCDAVFKKFWDGRSELAFAYHPAVPDGNQRAKFWEAARKTAYDDIPRLLEEIERSARSVIHG